MTKKRTQTSDNPTTADRLTAELSFNRARKDHEPLTDSSLTYGDLRLLARQCAVIPDAARAVEEYSCRTPVSHIATEMSALAERLRQAAAPSTGAGMVRGLEWYPDPGAFPYKTWGAQSSFGRFLIEEVSASDSPAYEVRYTPHHLIAVKDDLEEAKAAAQADYERRILAALEAAIPLPAMGVGTALERAERTIAARDRRIARLVDALNYARAQGVRFPADDEPPVVLSASEPQSAVTATVKPLESSQLKVLAEIRDILKPTRIDILREWFGGERYARDYEYLDANYSEQATRVVAYLSTISPVQAVAPEPVAQWHPGVMRALSEKTIQTSDTTKGLSAVLREWAGNYEEGSFDTEAGLMAEAADALDTIQSRLEEAEAERDEARALVIEANNSLYGSQGYFHSLNGGPFDKYHLATGIENLKDAARRLHLTLARAEAAEAKLAEAGKALEPFAKYIEGGMELDNKGQPLPDDQNLGWIYLTYADFRRARSIASTISTKGDAG